MRNLDIFGEQVRIQLNKQYSIKTAIGGYLTILTLILVVVFTWFIGNDIVYKERPVSYMQKDIFTNYQNISINETNFPFSFTMMDENNVPLVDYSYLTLKLYELKYQLNDENQIFQLINSNEIPVKFCNYSDYPLLTQEKFDDLQLAFTLCPVKKSFNLYGYWSEAELNFLQISIEQCKNTTESEIICKTPNEIEKFIGQTGTNLNILYVDARVRINNNTNPLEYLSMMSYKYVVPEYYKQSTYKIQSQNIMTDNGFIFSENDNTQFFRMVEEFTDIRVIDTNRYQLLAFELYSSNISETYYRGYIKVPDIIASLGGILEVFTISFLTLNTVFSTVEKNISIVNEVFILNKKGSNDVLSIEDTSKKMENTNTNLLKSTNNKILNNNFLKLNSISSRKNVHFSPPIVLSSIESLKQEKGLDFPVNLKQSSRSFYYFKTNLKKLNSRSDDFNCKNDSCKCKYHNIRCIDGSSNNNNNFLKSKHEEGEIMTNKPLGILNSNLKKYLSLRKSRTKLFFGFKDVIKIICNRYFNTKIPNKLKENFDFYEKARSSIEHYFDLIFMIKRFEEVNIMKNCLLSEEQSKMIEIMSKPILSSKNLFITKNSIPITNYSRDLNEEFDNFIRKVSNNKDNIDKKIIQIIEDTVQKCNV